MPEVVSSRVPKRGYKREIISLLVALVLCAEVAASLGALTDIADGIVLAFTVLIGLATIAFALVRGGVSSTLGNRGRAEWHPGPPAGQSVAVALAMSMGVVFFTYVSLAVGVVARFAEIDDLEPQSAASALFSPAGQFWLIFNPFSLVCGIAIVLLFARMLHLSRSGLAPTLVKAIA